MGNFATKHLTHMLDSEDQPATATPKSIKVLPFDPRSPSENMKRTPIVAVSKKTNEAVTPLTLPDSDPRSPTSEVDRTPVRAEGVGHLRKKVLNTQLIKQLEIESNGKEDNAISSNNVTQERKPLSDISNDTTATQTNS